MEHVVRRYPAFVSCLAPLLVLLIAGLHPGWTSEQATVLHLAAAASTGAGHAALQRWDLGLMVGFGAVVAALVSMYALWLAGIIASVPHLGALAATIGIVALLAAGDVYQRGLRT